MHIKSLFLLITISLFFLTKKASAQSGCTDPQAKNYDSAATENDGSCEYKNTDYTPICLEKLPDELPECSGVQYFDGQLYAHNDGGDGPQFFEIDTTNGSILRSIWIDSLVHYDWEDIAQSETHIFLGDFGNNVGARRDLKIIKIKKSDLAEDSVVAEEIYFNFADQTDFTPRSRTHDYDCEAFFHHNDSLYLFSKNWENGKTRMYVLPDESGSFSLEPRTEFDVQGLITAADISTDGKNILLLGYTPLAGTFLWLLFDYQDFMPFSGNKRRIDMGTFLTRGQVEGLTFQNQNEGFIASENISFVEGKLMRFKITQWIENPDSKTVQFVDNSMLHFYPNPFFEELLIDVESGNRKVKKVELFDQSGKRILKKRNGFKNRIRINGNKLSAGIYVMKVTLKGGGVIVEKVVKR